MKTSNSSISSCMAGKRNGFRTPGFSLIEIIVVLVVLGIISVFAMSRFTMRGSDHIAEADALKSLLRYAQSRAMADVYTWGVQINANSYTLIENNPNISTPVIPGSGSSTRNALSGITLSTTLPSSIIRFDWRGQPVSAAITSPGQASTPFTSNQTITVTGASAVTITIIPYTGFIQ